MDYLAKVKDMHENGGAAINAGAKSLGYGYKWQRSEADKNILRTHTTSVSAKMLYKLGQECVSFPAVSPSRCRTHHQPPPTAPHTPALPTRITSA